MQKKTNTMDFYDFLVEAKARGISHVLRDVSEYKGGLVSKVIYAVKQNCLVGCYSEVQGGKYFKKPMRQWSPSRRKFEKIKT